MTDEIDLRSLKAEQKQEWEDAVRELAEKGLLKEKTYIGRSDTYKAYVFVLDTGEGAKTALEYVAIETDKDDGWIDEVKHNPVGKQLLSRVMQDTAKHPVSVSMKDNKVLTTSSKRAIKESRSISSTLNALSDLVNLSNRISELENRVGTLEDAVSILVDHAGQTEERLDNLESGVAQLSKEQMKLKAYDMHDNGYTQQQIADTLSKTRKTIGNWLKSRE